MLQIANEALQKKNLLLYNLQGSTKSPYVTQNYSAIEIQEAVEGLEFLRIKVYIDLIFPKPQIF